MVEELIAEAFAILHQRISYQPLSKLPFPREVPELGSFLRSSPCFAGRYSFARPLANCTYFIAKYIQKMFVRRMDINKM